jgi:hypothetical protein
MSSMSDRSHLSPGGVAGTHRLALELEVDDDAVHVAPEEWELRHLAFALHMGVAKPLRTIRGPVVDREHDRLSAILKAMADSLEEAVHQHWMATTPHGEVVARALDIQRPSLEVMIELDQLTAMTRQIASRLDGEGL